MIHNRLCNLYAASCHEQGGIIRYDLLSDGGLLYRDTVPLDRVTYMTVAGDRLWAVLRQPFPDGPFSGLAEMEIHRDGRLGPPAPLLSTLGVVACHVSADEERGDVYVANYLSGSAIKMPDRLVVHEGSGVRPSRQEGPHTHQVVFTPDKKYVCVTDLGLDRIFVYDRDMKLCSEAAVPAGHGVRHLCFAPDGQTAFSINELASTVSVFGYNAGALEYRLTVDALPGKNKERTAAAAIRISADGRYLYASNRGDDSISCFEVRRGVPHLFAVVDCAGLCPRDFIISPDGAFLIVANEDSDRLAVFTLRNGVPALLSNQYSITRPVCVVCKEVPS